MRDKPWHITNDQAEGLVDTERFRALGFATSEVAGGCFVAGLKTSLRGRMTYRQVSAGRYSGRARGKLHGPGGDRVQAAGEIPRRPLCARAIHRAD